MLAWVLVGGVLLLCFNKTQLFAPVNMYHNGMADVLMYYITFMGQPEVIIPGLLALMLVPQFRTKWYFIIALTSNIAPFFMQQIIKRMFHAPRPLTYFHRAAWLHHLPNWPELLRDSFPSGHSQGAFSFFCFLSLLLPKKYRWVGIMLFILAISVCYSRMYLAAHFFKDVYVGSIIGGVTTTILYSLMQGEKHLGEK
jgi:membrane-associated phospholipid phosphatase